MFQNDSNNETTTNETTTTTTALQLVDEHTNKKRNRSHVLFFVSLLFDRPIVSNSLNRRKIMTVKNHS